MTTFMTGKFFAVISCTRSDLSAVIARAPSNFAEECCLILEERLKCRQREWQRKQVPYSTLATEWGWKND
jgi:hypothetical protein